MPQRSNDFQKLILLLESQLAPRGAKITESKLLKDNLDGSEREVDVYIEAEIGGHPICIGVECIDHDRRADVLWIDSIIGKHANLKIDKTIVVSKSGFSKWALKKALARKLHPITLEEAKNTDWAFLIRNSTEIKMMSFLLPYLVGFTIVVPEGGLPPDKKNLDGSTEIFGPTGNSNGTILNVGNRIISTKEIIDHIEKLAYTDSSTVVEIRVPFQKGCYIIDKMNVKHEFYALILKAKCRKEVTNVHLNQHLYGKAAVAVGTGRNFAGNINIALSQLPGKNAQAGISFYKVPKSKKPS